MCHISVCVYVCVHINVKWKKSFSSEDLMNPNCC